MNFRKKIKITYIKKFKEKAKETQEGEAYPHKKPKRMTKRILWEAEAYDTLPQRKS